MNVYIWARLDKMSTNYHDAGGLAVVAESLDAARELMRVKKHCIPKDSDAFTTPPTRSYTIGHAAEPEVFTFPDAGCC